MTLCVLAKLSRSLVDILQYLGICLEIDLDKKSFTMSFPAFNLECSKSFKYLNKFCYILMPEGKRHEAFKDIV